MKTIKEIWKPIEGFENYEVSNLGRIKSLWYGKEKILKPMKTKNGYLQVALYKDGKMKMVYVHRLVATAFIPNPLNFTEINHIDEDKTNNAKFNIEWCDAKYNVNYGSRNKRAAAALTNHPAFSKAVEASRFSDFRTIDFRFASTKEAERNGFNRGNISSCCNGCYSTHRGNFYKNLYWRFAS